MHVPFSPFLHFTLHLVFFCCFKSEEASCCDPPSLQQSHGGSEEVMEGPEWRLPVLLLRVPEGPHALRSSSLSLSLRSIRLPQSSCQLLLRQAHVTRCNLSHQIRNTTRTHTHSHTHRHVHTHTDTRNKYSDLALCAWCFIEIRVVSIKGRLQMLFLLFPDIAASLTRVKWSVVLFTQRDKKN